MKRLKPQVKSTARLQYSGQRTKNKQTNIGRKNTA